jgi:hypothetical protein
MFFMGSRLIIVGMTPSAIGFVSRRGPNNRLGITLMTLGATYTGIMVSRIIGRSVTEIYSRPVRCVVALVTLQARHKMIAGLSCRGGSIVTARTASSHQSMIKIRWDPCQSVVATIALC